MRLKQYGIHDGYKLYEVRATYAKQLKPNMYYIVAKSKSEVKAIFNNKYSWLNVVSSVTECDEGMIKIVVNNPALFLVS